MDTNERDIDDAAQRDTTTRYTDGPLSRRRFVQAGAATGLGALALGGSTPAAAQSVEQESCEGEYEKFEVGEGGNFVVMNNQWTDDGSRQCIYTYSDGSYGWDFESPGNGPNYPEVYIGGRPWGEFTGTSEFDNATRGDIDDLSIDYDAEYNVGGGEWNLALEWWLQSEPVGTEYDGDTPGYITHEIMLVLNHGGGHSHGSMQERNVAQDDNGNTIHLWSDNVNGGVDHAQFMVFVLDQPRNSGEVDLSVISDFLTERYGTDQGLYFTGIELGTEYWPGCSGDIRFNRMNVTVNGNTYQSGSDVDSGPAEPSAPADVSVTNVGETSADVEWDGVDGASGYTVSVDGDETDVSGTSTTVEGLDPGTDYEVAVAAYNDAGSSEESTESFTTDEEDTGGDGLGACEGDLNGDGEVTTADVSEFQSQLFSDEVQNDPDCYSYAGGDTVSHGDVIALFNDATGL